MRKRSLLLALGGLGAVAAAVASLSSSVSCASNALLDVEVTDPDHLKDGATYAQLAIFQGACPSDEQLAFGDIKGAVRVQTIEVEEPISSDIGPLKKDKYGFAALLRRDDCAVLGFGCTPVDLKVHRHVTIEVAPVVPPSGECKAALGESCVNGGCTKLTPSDGGPPVEGGADADGGPKPVCTLEPVPNAGAELPAPSIGNASVVGPSAVATPTGFLTVYREANADSANAIRLPVGDDGVAKAAQKDALVACVGDPSSNGITAGWNGVAKLGLMAHATPDCADGGATSAVFTSFDQDGKKVNSVIPPLVAYELKFQSVNGVAGTPNDVSFMLASLEKDPVFHPRIFSVGSDLNPAYDNTVPATSDPATFVRIAAASGINALAYDMAADAGGGVNFYVGAPNSTYHPQAYAAGTTAAVAAWSDKAMLVIPTASGIQWVVRNAQGTELKKGTLSLGTATAVDVVALNDHFIVVAAELNKLTLFRFDLDGETITAPAKPIVLPAQVGAAKLDRFDGKMMSAAGARNRVFITWLNKSGALGEGSSPGGYALFQCDG